MENLLLKYADVYVNESCVKTHAYYLYCHYWCRVYTKRGKWNTVASCAAVQASVQRECVCVWYVRSRKKRVTPIAFLSPFTKCLWLKLNTVVKREQERERGKDDRLRERRREQQLAIQWGDIGMWEGFSSNYKNENDRENWSVYGGFYRIKYTCCYFALPQSRFVLSFFVVLRNVLCWCRFRHCAHTHTVHSRKLGKNSGGANELYFDTIDISSIRQ